MIAAVELVALKGVEHETIARYVRSDREFPDYAGLLTDDAIQEQDGRCFRVRRRTYLRTESGLELRLLVEVFGEVARAEVPA